MLVSQMKTVDEVAGLLDGCAKVFLVGCDGCAEVCKTAGRETVAQFGKTLEERGKKIVGTTNVDFLCNRVLTGTRLVRNADQINEADALLVFSCGIGVQAVGGVVDKPVVPAANTVSMGGSHGLWPGEEKCAQCGDCLLGLTGGICPITGCSKSLVNGQCGGTGYDGSCEVSKDHPCGWKLIYDRLKELGRLDDMRKLQAPRDHRKWMIPDAIRRTVRYALEVGAQEPPAVAPAAGPAPAAAPKKP